MTEQTSSKTGKSAKGTSARKTRGNKTKCTLSRKKSGKGPKFNPLNYLLIGLGFVAIAFMLWLLGLTGYSGNEQRIYIPSGISEAAVADTLKAHLGKSFGSRVDMLRRVQGGSASAAHGSYVITDGESALTIARRLAQGRQTPLHVTIGSWRTLDRLYNAVGAVAEVSPEQFAAGVDSVLAERGLTRAEYPAAFLPDTYDIYWTWPASRIAHKLLDGYDNFWTTDRLNRAKAIGLTPAQVSTIASIVEEETAKRDERPMVARLYLNRLKKNMRLQADPTVKFATGNFKLRRITGEHLRVQSPYNTYQNNGLPPGPIRLVEAATLDAVLNAPQHDYLYMCAREDFSGYHNFATDYATHQANARRYQAELNRRNIK